MRDPNTAATAWRAAAAGLLAGGGAAARAAPRAVRPAGRRAFLLRGLGAGAGALVAVGCADSPVRDACATAAAPGAGPAAAARCAALRESSWRSSSAAARGRRGLVGPY